MSKRRVLVVDDDPTIADSVAARLRAEGLNVWLAHDGPSAVAACRDKQIDLVVLDVMLPGFDGLEVCRRIQAERPVPVLMLTARADETDMLVGLGIGADDYLSKPFSMRELVARVHALLRRTERAENAARITAPPVRIGELEIDIAERKVRRGLADVHLTRTEFDLLAYLAVHPRAAISRESLLAELWGWGDAGGSRFVHRETQRRSVLPDRPNRPCLPSYVVG